MTSGSPAKPGPSSATSTAIEPPVARATTVTGPRLGFHERRRTFALAAALGARTRQLGGFVWGESAFVTGGGLILGTAIAAGIAALLVKVLTGVFDPPPDHPAVPWGYLGVVLALTLGAVWIAGRTTLLALRRRVTEELRDV